MATNMDKKRARLSIKKEAISGDGTQEMERSMIEKIMAESLVAESEVVDVKPHKAAKKVDKEPKAPKDPIDVLKSSLEKKGSYIEKYIDYTYKEDDVNEAIFKFETDLLSLKAKVPEDALITHYETKLQNWKKNREKKERKEKIKKIIYGVIGALVAFKIISWMFF